MYVLVLVQEAWWFVGPYSNDEVLKFGRICVQEMMGGLLYFTQLHLLRCTTHTSDSAASLCSGYKTLTVSAGRPCGNHCRIKQTFKEPVCRIFLLYICGLYVDPAVFSFIFKFFNYYFKNLLFRFLFFHVATLSIIHQGNLATFGYGTAMKVEVC